MGAPLEYKAPLLNSSVHNLINGGGSDDGGGGAAAVEACTGIPSVPLSWSRTNASIEQPDAGAVVSYLRVVSGRKRGGRDRGGRASLKNECRMESERGCSSAAAVEFKRWL